MYSKIWSIHNHKLLPSSIATIGRRFVIVEGQLCDKIPTLLTKFSVFSRLFVDHATPFLLILSRAQWSQERNDLTLYFVLFENQSFQTAKTLVLKTIAV